MSRIRIIHKTVYRYAKPVEFLRHRLVIRPREGHDVQVLRQQLSIKPAHQISWSRDLFGNSVAWVDFCEMADRLKIHNEITASVDPAMESRAPGQFHKVPLPVDYSEWEKPVAAGYLEMVFPGDREGLLEWLRRESLLPGGPGEATHLVQELNRWIFHSISYRRREEKGVQTPLQTLEWRSGSCRDMATLMLAGLRTAGLAARFASGYLDSEASAAGRASTHAWVEVYFPQQGWCGCDPTLGESTSAKHILTGVSSHPRGVMPISGSFVGDTRAYLGMDVSVRMEKISEDAVAAELL